MTGASRNTVRGLSISGKIMPAPGGRFLCLILLLAVSACVSSGRSGPDVPGWLSVASPATSENCPNLAGRFANRASAVYPADAEAGPTLTQVFRSLALGPGPREYRQTWSVPVDAASVWIEQEPEALSVTFVGEDEERIEQRFRRFHLFRSEKRYDDLFSCYLSGGEPRLRFLFAPASQQAISGAPLYMGGSDVFMHFYRATDGALIVQTVNESVGLSAVIIGSHYSRRSVWSRYEQLGEGR